MPKNFEKTLWSGEEEIYHFLKKISGKNIGKIKFDSDSVEKIYQLFQMFWIDPAMREPNSSQYRMISFHGNSRQGLDKDFPNFRDIAEFYKARRFPEENGWYMSRGKRQSLTYRTNRIYSNLSKVFNMACEAAEARHIWTIIRDYEAVGCVVAATRREAEILGSAMYPGVRNDIRVNWNGPFLPTRFINKQNEHLDQMNSKIKNANETIERQHEIIAMQQQKVEFCMLNMTHFCEHSNEEG